MILNALGEEIRQQVEVPAGVIAELQAFHPLLGIQWLPFHRTWALTWNWGLDPTDPRMRHVQGGRMPSRNAYAILCILPQDCSPSEAVGFARQNLVMNPPSDYWRTVADRIDRDNLKMEEAVTQAALADVYNRIEVSHLMGTPRFLDDIERDTRDPYLDNVVEAPSAEEIQAAKNGGYFS